MAKNISTAKSTNIDRIAVKTISPEGALRDYWPRLGDEGKLLTCGAISPQMEITERNQIEIRN
jgi:hypothetical protein